MKIEFINNVKEEEVLGKNIFNHEGKILLKAGTKLNHEYISKLKKLGILYVYIEDYRLSDILKEDEYFDELKQNSIKSMHEINRGIKNSNPNNIKELIKVVEEIIDYIMQTKDVQNNLYEIKTYDNYTQLHSLNTFIMSMFLGGAVNLDKNDMRELGMASVLHDVGKIKVDINIINKTSKLSEDEFMKVKKHPIYGAEILKKFKCFSSNVIEGVLEHHEKIDGSGYPNGFSGEKISKFAKIISICDVYDAVINDRVYRKKLTLSNAYNLILRGSGCQFDENLVDKFKDTFSMYPLGTCVKLSSGEEGYVIMQNSNFHDKPIIRILYDSRTRRPVPFYEIDIMKNPEIEILGVV